MPDPDLPLLDRFSRGDHAALGELAARHERALLGLALGLLNDRTLAQDAVQELWLRVIRSASNFQRNSAVKTWLYRILINRCIDLRARARPKPPEPGLPEPNAGPEVEETVDRVRSAVRQLPEAQRVVILMNYHEHLTPQASADILGIPLGTFKSRLHAALTTLRARLNAEAAP